MKIGERVAVEEEGSPGIKVGIVRYIHPKKRFYMLEFRMKRIDLLSGKYDTFRQCYKMY